MKVTFRTYCYGCRRADMTQTWHDDIPDGKVIPGEVVDVEGEELAALIRRDLDRAFRARIYAMQGAGLHDPRSIIHIVGGIS